MPTIRVLPEDVIIEAAPDETVLGAALRAGIDHAHACGGHARCSTCRIHVERGDGSDRTPAEQAMADRLGFAPDLRLACQMSARDDLTVRRLVLDDHDVALVDQRRRAKRTEAGQEFELGILFVDIRGFTAFSERLPPHDVVHVLNRFFHVMGTPIQAYGGRIDNYMGDGLLALFGLSASNEDPATQAVKAALAMLDAMDALKPYLLSAYGRDFDVRIGVHYGEAVVGSIGAIGSERTTAIGDAVNTASRIEGACKAMGTRLLVSEAVRARLHDAHVGRQFTVPIAGKTGQYRLYEILAIHQQATASSNVE